MRAVAPRVARAVKRGGAKERWKFAAAMTMKEQQVLRRLGGLGGLLRGRAASVGGAPSAAAAGGATSGQTGAFMC